MKHAALALAGLVVGCGDAPTQAIAPVAIPDPVAVPDMRRPASFAVEIESSRMVTTARPPAGSPCTAFTYPVDGAAAFEAAVRSATSDAARSSIRRVSVTGERLTYRYDTEPATRGSVMLAPTATIAARLRIDTSAGTTEATMQATGSGRRHFSLDRQNCDAMGAALGDAYGDALRDMEAQLSNRIRLAR